MKIELLLKALAMSLENQALIMHAFAGSGFAGFDGRKMQERVTKTYEFVKQLNTATAQGEQSTHPDADDENYGFIPAAQSIKG